MKQNLGRQITVQKQSEKKTYSASNLIQKPQVLLKVGKKWFLNSENEKITSGYKFRYAFDHERANCNIPYNRDEDHIDYGNFSYGSFNNSITCGWWAALTATKWNKVWSALFQNSLPI